MRALFYFIILGLILTLYASDTVHASHSMGGDITVRCIDPANSQYFVTVAFYRDCSGVPQPTSFSIRGFTPSGCSGYTSQANSFPAFDLPHQPCGPSVPGGIACEISQLCESYICASCCQSSPCTPIAPPCLPGVQKFLYSDTITLPGNCPDWVIWTDHCCRNGAITNLAAYGNIFLWAEVNDTLGECNNSPVFHSDPIFYACDGSQVSTNMGAYDPDGDSLYYSLVAPSNAYNVPIPYVTPFTPTQPLTTANGVTLNPKTGELSFVPQTIQQAVLTLLVEEFRDGVKIGSVIRDIQMIILSNSICNSQSPDVKGLYSVSGADQIDSVTMVTCPGSNVEFRVPVVSNDPTGIYANLIGLIPQGASIQVDSISYDSVHAIITWTPSSVDTGRYFFTIEGSNNACPVTMRTSRAFELIVQGTGQVTIQPDTIFTCGSPVPISAIGAVNATWWPAEVAIFEVGATTYIHSSVPTSIAVSSVCGTDTAYIDTVASFNLKLRADTAVCLLDTALFEISFDSSQSPYEISWYSTASFSSFDSTQLEVLAASEESSEIRVIAIGKNGCYLSDTAELRVSTFDITADLINESCVGTDDGSASIQVGTATRPLTYQWDHTPANDSALSNLSFGDYSVTVSDAINCADSLQFLLPRYGFEVLIDPTASPDSCADTLQLSAEVKLPSYEFQCSESPYGWLFPIDTLQLGNGGNTWPGSVADYPSIYGNWDNSSRHQMLFKAEELIAMGGEAGLINAIAMNIGVFYPSGIPTFTDFCITIVCTSLDSLVQWESTVGAFTECFQHSPKSGWNWHHFTNGFEWDGQSDLVIEVCTNEPTSNYWNHKCRYTNTTFNSMLYSFGSSPQCLSTATPINAPSKQRPNTRFTFAQPDYTSIATISWHPPYFVMDSTSLTPIIFPDSIVDFIVTVTDTNGCAHSDTVLVQTLASQLQVDAGPDVFICEGDQVQLSAQGPASASYLWLPFNMTGSSITVNIDSTTIVYVVSASPQLCVNADTLIVWALPNPEIDLGADTSILDTDSIQLGVAGNYASYVWSTLETTPSIWFHPDSMNFGSNLFWLQVADANGCLDTDTILVFVNVGTGITDLTTSNFTIRPNPANQMVVVEYSHKGKWDLDMLNASGKTVMTMSDLDSDKQILDIANLPSGTYFLRLITAEQSEIRKIQIVR